VTFHSKMLINSRSAKFTSSKSNNPSVYFVQCLFKGELSLSDLAATINALRKIRCRVVSMPTALAGKRLRNLFKYTRVAINVGVCTLEYAMRFLMKLVKEMVGLMDNMREGDKWWWCRLWCFFRGFTWMMELVVATRKLIMSRETGCLEKILKASLSDIIVCVCGGWF
jgi:hypothetical protein